VREESLLLAGPQPAPHGDYAYKKHLAEEELKEVCRKENIPWTILRPSFIYGKYNYAPRESYFFDLIFEGKALILPDNTPALFTFVSVWDVARAIIGIMGNRETHSQVFNLSGRELVSYMRFADVLRIIAGIDIRIEMMSLEKIISLNVPLPFPLDEHLIYSGERITRVIDFSYTPFLEGLQATYHWYARTRKRLR
jgi:nucleoside-diphosphate-sugar epimerase